MNTFLVRVTAKQREAEDIASFELASTDGSALPPFPAGAHIDVEIRPGLVRQYSLCNYPAETHRYLIAVLRDPNSRGGSAGMHDTIQVGDIIRISEPKNHFALMPAERYVLLAGGIGVTPILCMAERLHAIGAEFTLHYCARSLERAAFTERIKASGFASRVRFYFDADASEPKLDLAEVLGDAGPGSHVYVCGPSGFIDFVADMAKNRGWPVGSVHQEYFGAAPQDSSRDAEFSVRLASTGVSYSIPAGKTIVQVLAEHGIAIQVSCEQGVCGTCITKILDGQPDHRDMYFSEEEQARNDQFTPCCSRSKSATLTLDL
jgi:vanillate O-demethylase ferredoxin subunit